MLIYSFEKEFIGIGEEYLRIFGFPNLEELQAEHADFADFFVKQPGYVHNFQHVHWIDFIDCAESVEESKVMINIHSKTFTANISITTIYLSQNPSSKSYIIRLNNLRQLSGDTGEEFLVDIAEEPPAPLKVKKEIPVTPVTVPPVIQKREEASILLDDTPLEIENTLLLDDIPETLPLASAQKVPEKALDIDLDFEEETVSHPVHDVQTEPEVQEEPKVQEEVFVPEEDDYIFDPKVASDELGLPIDLIEEFIEDFIAQAKEFQVELFDALERVDMETVASLSHKLKGVAGNLRIENAYDKLCIINTSKETAIVKKNLQQFYYIVAQLAGEEAKTVLPPKEVEKPLALDFDDDDFVLDFKEEEETPALAPTLEEAEEIFEEPEEIIEEKAPEVTITYSKASAANEIGLDSETFNELFDDYIQESFLILENIKKALDVDDMALCRKKGLLLKSMSESMHVEDLTSDLSSIINMSDKNSITIALKNIEAIVQKISK